MKSTSFTSDASSEMLQSPDGKMLFVIHLVILVCVSKHAAGFTPTECENIGNVHEKLEAAEQMIKSAKEKLPTNLHSSLPKDCEDLLNNGQKKSGVYLVWPMNRILSRSISVYCDMETDEGGWTVIQRRGNFSREKDYFYQEWQVYKEGFGYLKEDFWLGNDYIYALSNQKLYSIRFDLEDFEGNKRYAIYDKFWIEEENGNYTLHITDYSGNAGDSFSYHNGCAFTTKDRDNDKHPENNCAHIYKGAWWFNKCFISHLNGEYSAVKTVKQHQSIQWRKWKGDYESLATSEMKIRKMRSG